MKKTLPLLILLSAACAEEQTSSMIGNPTVALDIRVTSSALETSPAALVFLDDEGTEYTLSDASAYVRDIEIDLPDGVDCEDIEADLAGGAVCENGDSGSSDSIVVDGPFVVDLVAGTATPSIAEIRLPSLPFRRVDIRLDDGRVDDGLLAPGDELVDRSLVVRADFEYMDEPVVLELSLKFNEDVRIEEPGGVELSDSEDLVVLLDAAGWFEGIRIGRCLDDDDLVVEDGVLVIDDDAGSGSCSSVEGDIKDNIKESGQLRGE